MTPTKNKHVQDQEELKEEQLTPEELSDVEVEVAKLQDQLIAAQESERRALADYQNLMRRTQEDRIRMVKLAAKDFVSRLIQPLDHLSLAAAQIQDKGLDMVVGQFWNTLNEAGLEEIQVMGQEFDPAVMEVVEKQGEGMKVIKVVSKGYKLNGEVIQVAKVVIG